MQQTFHMTWGDGPVIVSIPHAGCSNPSPYANPEDRGRIADVGADMIGGRIARTLDATVIASDVTRLWCDVERWPDDREEMNRVGMGVVYTRNADMQPLYPEGGEPDEREIGRRMAALYQPYHKTLTMAARLKLDTFRNPVLLDVHTYCRTPLPYELHANEPRPTVIIGHNGDTAGLRLATLIAGTLNKNGIDFAVNTVFKGAITPNRVTDPRLACVMVETRRDKALAPAHTIIADAVADAIREYTA